MAANFKAGDLIVLKSGSPTMTVDSVESDGVRAVWFAGAKRDSAYFNFDSIELAPPKQSPSGSAAKK